MGFQNTILPNRRLPCAVKNRFNFISSFFRWRRCEADVIEMKLDDYENGVNKYGQVLIKCVRKSKKIACTAISNRIAE